MTDYETCASAIALKVWEKSTGNGAHLNQDMWDEHMQNCHDATANAYQDGIEPAEWERIALQRVAGNQD